MGRAAGPRDGGCRGVPRVHRPRGSPMRIGCAAMTADAGAVVATTRWAPTRREAWLSVLLVFAVALGVRLLAAAIIGFPKPEDTSYYVGAARNLVEGRGLVSDALWSFGTPPLVFPRPAFEVWLPLPTFLAAIPMALFGHTYAAAQL